MPLRLLWKRRRIVSVDAGLGEAFVGGIILVIVILVLAAVFIYAASKPSTFRIARSTVINAPAATIFPLIADFHQWPIWSPYEKLDPELKRSYGGAESGVGATYSYEGNSKVGAGRMEVVRVEAPNLIQTKLDFSRPMVAHNLAEFTLEPKGQGTEVTWSMSGPQAFVGKVMSLVFSIDRLVGGQFEEGLANLKAVAEAKTTDA